MEIVPTNGKSLDLTFFVNKPNDVIKDIPRESGSVEAWQQRALWNNSKDERRHNHLVACPCTPKMHQLLGVQSPLLSLR
jgi:hypothetical protein